MSLSLACEDSGHSDPSEQMGRCSPHHGGILSRVVDILAHAGYYTLQGGTTVGIDTQEYKELCHRVQCYVEGCRLIRTNPLLGHSIQWRAGLCNEE